MSQTEADIAPTPADAEAFRYDAFISYRHVDPDRTWAKWLHGALETYRVPKKLVHQKGLPRRIGRVFRDEEELPASDDLNAQIEQALAQSRFLICICSPRTPQSQWVNREVERFREMGKHDHILALLIEGEPGDSFPKALHEIRHRLINADGGTYERVEEIEPLAADVRPTRHERRSYLRRMAKLRVLACLLQVKFDDLRQREQERRARRLEYLGATLGILLAAMVMLVVFAFQQRAIAVQQRLAADEQRHEADAQRQRAQVQLAQGIVLQGDLLGAADRWIEARQKYTEASELFQKTSTDPLPAELGMWDASRHVCAPLGSLPGHPGGVWAIAVSPDGRQAISGGTDKLVRLSNLVTGAEVHSFTGHTDAVRAVCFLPDGKRAISASEDKSIRLWDLSTGVQLHRFDGHQTGVRAIAISADGHQLLSGDAAGTLKLWDIDTGNLIRTIDGVESVFCLAVSADNRQALCGGVDAKIRLVDLSTGTIVRTLEGHGIAPVTVAFMGDGKTAFSAGYDNHFNFWDIATARVIRTFDNPSGRVSSAVISADGKTVMAGMWDGTLKRFDAADGKLRRSFVSDDMAMVRQIALSPNGTVAVTGSVTGQVKTWNTAGVASVRSWKYGALVTGTGFSRDGRLALTMTGTGHFELWDTESQQTLFQARDPKLVPLTAVLCPDATSVLAGGAGGFALVDVRGVKPTITMAGHVGLVMSVAVSPDGKLGLSGGDDMTARVWDLSDGRQLQLLQFKARVNSVAFSLDGRLAITGGLGGVQMWDTHQWKLIRNIGRPATDIHDACSALAFLPDGNQILVGTQAGTLKLYDVAAGTEIRTFSGAHTDIIGCLAISSDGKLAVTGSDDKTLRLWDIASGVMLRVLQGHDAQLRTVSFSPDGRSILSGGLDGNLMFWNLASLQMFNDRRSKLTTALAAMQKDPNNTGLVLQWQNALGDWYAINGFPAWALETLQAARTGGANISPLQMGNCNWQTGRYADAIAEFTAARQQHLAPDNDLALCIDSLNKSAAEKSGK